MCKQKYSCPLYERPCAYGGNKHYDYGFVRGTAPYCRFVKKWVSDMKECPLSKQEQIKRGEKECSVLPILPTSEFIKESRDKPEGQ